MSIKQKVFKYTRLGMTATMSRAWYEEVNGYKCYQHASVSHVVMDGVLCVSFILLMCKVTIYIRIKNKNKGK